jgi:indole-3-glycerol phosphate synthase
MFLDTILAKKLLEVAERKHFKPLTQLEQELALLQPERRDFRAALSQGERPALIAEIKKASPSKGLLCPDFDPERLARSYETAGAAAISVLTDAEFFQGSLDYLQRVKAVTSQTPLLRKDFIIDPYQIFEARLAGADAVLLIVAALDDALLSELLHLASILDLAALVEVHDEAETIRALAAQATLIGINNRDLKSFEVTLETTFRLLPLIGPERITVSESGIKDRADLERLGAAGVQAVLIGEALVTAADPAVKIRELMGWEA